ncbi:MAG TPA: nickel-binding protein, partial [Pricia sp.]|nr:nickel-binding protein [Pricia sp.]
MPLFMDVHHILDSVPFTEEDAYKAHLRDLAVQDRYGLVYIKYYLNLPQKTICCLMDGPSIEACRTSHEEAHGIGACNVIEVSPGNEFFPYLGEGSKNDKDLALTLSGEIDTGYRTLMMVRLADLSGKHERCTEEIYQSIARHKGCIVMQPNDKIMASFVYAFDAISCALETSHFLESITDALDYSMAVVTGKPVDENGSEIFEEARKHLQMLCGFGQSKVVHIDTGTKTLARKGSYSPDWHEMNVQFVSAHDFSFFAGLWKILHNQITDSDFKSARLCTALGLSKAQTYRKLKALTGMSPNTFIREIRLRRALAALKKNDRTVAEIAYEQG